DLAVVADRQGRTNFHRALRGRRFSVALWLLGKIDGRLVVVRFQKVRSFFETSATHRAGRVDVPGTGNIQRLFAVFVGHIALLLTSFVRGNFFCGGGSRAWSRDAKKWRRSRLKLTASKGLPDPPYRFGVGVGIGLGSTSGSTGNIMGCGDGVGIASGDKTSPPLGVRAAPRRGASFN